MRSTCGKSTRASPNIPTGGFHGYHGVEFPWGRHAFFSRQSYSSLSKAITPWGHFSRDHILHATTLISNSRPGCFWLGGGENWSKVVTIVYCFLLAFLRAWLTFLGYCLHFIDLLTASKTSSFRSLLYKSRWLIASFFSWNRSTCSKSVNKYKTGSLKSGTRTDAKLTWSGVNSTNQLRVYIVDVCKLSSTDLSKSNYERSYRQSVQKVF